MRNLLQHIFLISVFLICALSAGAKVWTAEDIPMVHLQDRNRYVCDPDGLLSGAARDSADFYLKRLEGEKGVQSVFVVVGRVKDGDCFRVAQDIGNKFGVGDKETRRGLVIVVAVDDHRYFIAPGKGLEGEMTDVACDEIARNFIVTNMRAGNTDRAVVQTAKAVYSQVTTGKTGAGKKRQRSSAEDDDSPFQAFLGILIALLCFGYPLYRFFKHRGNKHNNNRRHRNRNHDDDVFPPFIFFGGGGSSFGDGPSGGSFGGGSFGGGGAGGSW